MKSGSLGCGSAPVGAAANCLAADILKLLNLIDLLFDSHLGEPQALVDAPLLEDLLHVRLAAVLRCRISLGALAGLGEDYHLVHVFFSLDDVLVGAGH